MLTLIGNGKWGRIYAKTLKDLNIPFQIGTRDNWQNLVRAGTDGVIVATPPQSHIEIASFALERNIPTLIEKPLAMTYTEAEKLKQFSAPILVNHIHLFSDRYQAIKEQITTDHINSIYSLGYNNGPKRNYSSLLDYAPHDLAMILDLSGQLPRSITSRIEQTTIGELHTITLQFETFYSISIIGNGGSIKKRQLSIFQDNTVLAYNGWQDKPLENTIKTFQKLIGGGKDSRAGLDLSMKVMKILDICGAN
jgi:predicted dehydrogenase